jgi:hypothetical protein
MSLSNFFKIILTIGDNEKQVKDYGSLPYFLALLGSIIWPLSWIYCNEHNLNIA